MKQSARSNAHQIENVFMVNNIKEDVEYEMQKATKHNQAQGHLGGQFFAQFKHEKEHVQTSSNRSSKMNLYAVQEIVHAHSDSIWVAKFSPCGNYLATGGKDAVLKIWKVR